MSDEAASKRMREIKEISTKLMGSTIFTVDEIRLIRAALIDQFIETFPGEPFDGKP